LLWRSFTTAEKLKFTEAGEVLAVEVPGGHVVVKRVAHCIELRRYVSEDCTKPSVAGGKYKFIGIEDIEPLVAEITSKLHDSSVHRFLEERHIIEAVYLERFAPRGLKLHESRNGAI
jgi:hypothetical protein